jgi:asparagine synthetase B (glutamine-hydrolysing)
VTSLAVSNLILRGDEQFQPAHDSDFSELRGHFALHFEGPQGTDEHVLARDALGVNKLFFALPATGGVDVSNYYFELRRRGHAADRIWSVPSGQLVRVSPSRRTLTLQKHSRLTPAGDEGAGVLERHAAAIRTRLESTFCALRPVLAGRPIYVTMSGGLDSTIIATLTRELIGDFVGVTFRIEGGASTHDDLHYARRVAETLGVPLEVVSLPPEAVVELLDPVLVYGQDFRDFNVHCGLVNAALGAALRERYSSSWGTRPVVLTGDTMNELVADYTPVEYGARTYYPLPNISPANIRRFLVTGLDSGDREVGIFAHYGIDTIQPYALCPEVYCAIPGSLLDQGSKQRLARLVMGDRVPSFIYERPKVRAQVGSSEEVGGTLAALVDRGIDAAALEARFCRLMQLEPQQLRGWIRGGYYRFTPTFPKE